MSALCCRCELIYGYRLLVQYHHIYYTIYSIPAVPVEYKPSFHVDLLCLLGPMPTAEEWKAKGNQNYGMVALSKPNKAAQVEKVDHATATKMFAGLGEIATVGSSLGSFSVSSSMLSTLLGEFARL